MKLTLISLLGVSLPSSSEYFGAQAINLKSHGAINMKSHGKQNFGFDFDLDEGDTFTSFQASSGLSGDEIVNQFVNNFGITIYQDVFGNYYYFDDGYILINSDPENFFTESNSLQNTFPDAADFFDGRDVVKQWVDLWGKTVYQSSTGDAYHFDNGYVKIKFDFDNGDYQVFEDLEGNLIYLDGLGYQWQIINGKLQLIEDVTRYVTQKEPNLQFLSFAASRGSADFSSFSSSSSSSSSGGSSSSSSGGSSFSFSGGSSSSSSGGSSSSSSGGSSSSSSGGSSSSSSGGSSSSFSGGSSITSSSGGSLSGRGTVSNRKRPGCEETCCKCDECNINKQFIRFFEEMLAFEKKECDCKEVVREITRYLIKDPEEPKVVIPKPNPLPPSEDPPTTELTPPVTGPENDADPEEPPQVVSCNGIELADKTIDEILRITRNGSLSPEEKGQRIADLINIERDNCGCSCCDCCKN